MAKAEAVKEIRRKQLIDATIRAIGRFGYTSTTLTHVAGEAGLSPGIVNFYFKSKDQLLLATLEQIAEEYSTFWQAAMSKGKVAPAAGLEAMIEADFHASVCNPEKISIWYAFWAEAGNNPAYQGLVQRLETDYTVQTIALCDRIISEGGYGIDARTVAVGLNAMIDGLWFDCLMEPKSFNRNDAKRVCRSYLAAVFPAHFAGGPKRMRAEDEAPLELVTDQDVQGRNAHRGRVAAALRKRVDPVGTIRREALAASVGVSAKTLEGWLDGRVEPSSWQLGRLIVATDAQLWMEIYGPLHEEMQRRFEARLAQQRAEADRERAALDALKGAPKG
ncbi:transcriptional regulator BetI [Dongia sedimenti]|uniref:Transcriptional regulator BetI n=1 Tax=Dongia sedimenti TaxID=3064282 RepID=A0ABU0YSW6_9PROT|nr:transcriptional regulator BetI [Rhodospirillaceae bacterium R-7]